MRANFLISFFLLTISYSEAKELKEPWYDSFRGVAISGFSSNNFKAIDVGAEFRKSNIASFAMFRHSSDQIYVNIGIYSEVHWYFPITKLKVSPFPILTSSLNSVTSKANEPLPKGTFGFINGVSISFGGGVFYEPNKFIQIGGSLNYEWQDVSGQKGSFNFRPLIHLKYEFRFI